MVVYLIAETEVGFGRGLIEEEIWYFREGLGKPTKYRLFMMAFSQTDIRKDTPRIQFCIAAGKSSCSVYIHSVIDIS